ncbi:hypothetical protein [Aquimarina sp. RZ0]|uniref:hypothetical protein n=1 Tax=Aquimarina sp. RZ0 TaxID=2607730 RepID=UPI0011F0F226|nr:hypothetical protein [Aquimarina sp. RZ0]KAA1247165.1 hypothetical protein F0000_04455 [Aquimarina sp. RZ0]
MKKPTLFALLILIYSANSYCQKSLSESVAYLDIKSPKQPLSNIIKTYSVIVETPYKLTAKDVQAKSKIDFEKEKVNYNNKLKKSTVEFEERLKNHDEEVVKIEERYKMEMEQFKKLSLIERLALSEQGKEPKLSIPSKPTYIQPSEPTYKEPDLTKFLIFDNKVLADGVMVYGYEKGGNDVTFMINITKMVFQDNGGQTFYNQPTNLKVLQGMEVIHEKKFDEGFQFLTATSSNTINFDYYEKNNVLKIMKNMSIYINEQFGYTPIPSTIKIEYPKNKKRKYDVLENTKIKSVTIYKKLNRITSLQIREKFIADLIQVKGIWKEELSKIDYKDKKATMNVAVAKIIFFNLLRVNISLKNKEQAEKTLELMQEKLIDLDLSNDQKRTLTSLEEQIYTL